MDDKIEKIDFAISEAQRFILRAKQWRQRLNADSYAKYGSKEGGAAKRSSLDLTRALSELRKS